MSELAVHVGLNLIYLVPGETGGMETYARELIPALVKAAPQAQFTAFINREAAHAADGPWGELIPAVTVPVEARHRVEWVRAEQTLLPRAASRAGVVLLHSLASTAPMRGRFRRVVTIHDLIYKRFPEAHAGIRARGMSVLVPWAARRSHRIIADSQSTAADLVELLAIRTELIDVVPLGMGSLRRAPALPESIVRARLELAEREVILCLSAKRPHKNLRFLLGVLAGIPVEQRPVLVIPGYPTAHESELREYARACGLERDVRFPAWLSAEELEGVWAIARAFVFPSLYEGFGLPVLEAMARGVPVACSNASSLPEVVGDAALLFDPHSESQAAEAVVRLLREDDLRARLRALGLVRAGQFTWERTARLTLSSYTRALGSRAPGPAALDGDSPEPSSPGRLVSDPEGGTRAPGEA